MQDRLGCAMDLAKISGIEVRAGCTVRGPAAQARMFCRSRSVEDVARWRATFARSAPLLASLFKCEWCSLGPRETVHAQGQSWHALGEAVDLFAVVGGMAIWEGSVARAVAESVREAGLWHSYHELMWQPRSRHWHVQLSRYEVPLMVRGRFDSLAEMEAELLRRFEF